MKRLILLVLVAGTVAGCGDSIDANEAASEAPVEQCAVTSQATELCGSALSAYCDLIDGATSPDADTRDVCVGKGDEESEIDY